MQLHPTGKFDNHASKYSYITAHPLAAAMGAEIEGVQLATLTDEQEREIKDALCRHKMIYLRNQQDLSHAQHEKFSLRFGSFAEDAYTSGVPGHRNVHPLIKEADDQSKMVFGEGWHNNHHAYQYSARHGLEWWEIDLTWMTIQLLQLLGLATNVKLAGKRQ